MAQLGTMIGRSERTTGRLIRILVELEFATYDGTVLQLTELGQSRTRSYDQREKTVQRFLADILGLSSADLRDDASRLAVVVSEKLVARMAARTNQN